MRIERTDSPHFHKCWLTSEKYQISAAQLIPPSF
jgi:hypothetical protein